MWVAVDRYGRVQASALLKSNLMVELEQLMKFYGYYTVEKLLEGEKWTIEQRFK
jgi:hypothetical protein